MDPIEKQSMFAGLYGNALEWYDFLLYASFAPLFAEIFFPAQGGFISLLITFTVFAVSFLVRPLGGALLGHYADHVGRRKALIASIVIMTVTTTSIALLPNYQHLGWISVVFFILFRLIQGVAIGGELPGSATFLSEHMQHYGRGFAGSLILSSAFIGIFAGSLTATLLSLSIPYEAFSTWGWRIAYLVGGGLGVVGIYLRIKSVESATFLEIKPTKELPAKLVFTRYKKQLALAVLFTSILALCNYIMIAYVTTFLIKTVGFALDEALLVNFVGLACLAILIPGFGLLADRLGILRVFQLGLVGLIVMIFPLYWLMASGIWKYALVSQLGLAMVLAPINATLPTLLVDMFPTAIRASGTSIGYNIGQALFGGTAPLVAIVLLEWTGNIYAQACYLFTWGIVVLISTFVMV